MSCSGCGPGYESPLAAMCGPREALLYVTCLHGSPNSGKPDYLATVDVNPESPTYSKVIHRMKGIAPGDEFHHYGWNACSSCHGDTNKIRNKLILPCLASDRIYIVDTTVASQPVIHKVIEGSELKKLGLSVPHTSHCLPNGDILISTMGDAEGNPKGDLFLLDSKTWTLKGTWTEGDTAKFGYDFWYQPYHDVLVASEWASPKSFQQGFIIEHAGDTSLYGRGLNFYSWSKRTLLNHLDLGPEGISPLEIRFLHDPIKAEGFVGCAVTSNVFRFFKEGDQWAAEKVIDIPNKKVTGWVLPELPGVITDILISLDDKFLYFSNWLQGDIRQYDISDTRAPRLVGQLFLGGLTTASSTVRALDEAPKKDVMVEGTRVQGGPQMLQLSLDGKRLYVTNSLFSSWDRQLYPHMVEKGSVLLKVDVDTEKGGLKLNEEFLVDFGKEPDGPVLAHECRYPGGDCTSDIWLSPSSA